MRGGEGKGGKKGRGGVFRGARTSGFVRCMIGVGGGGDG